MRNSRFFLLAGTMVVGVVLALWLTQRAVAPRAATWEDVEAEAKQGGYRLISIGELIALWRWDANSILLVDTRQEWEYRTGHIEGAMNFAMEPTWWSRWRKADALLNVLGPNKNQLVVFY
jgi:hypothetical protein